MQDDKEISKANLRKSPEQLAGSSNASPSIIISKVSVAYKPKAVRLKPVANHSPKISFNCDASVRAASSTLDEESIEISKENPETIILPIPIAQVVPSSAMLEILENYENHQQKLVDVHSQTQQLNQANCNQSTMNLHQSLTALSYTNKLHCSSYSAVESKKTKARPQRTTNNGDRKFSDGYNWRKYGQKQVKGGESPRGYYRCTHPGCPVKKMVERSKDGEISEIVYRWDHNHPKSQKIKQSSSSKLRGQASDPDVNGANSMDDILVDSLLEENFFENETENCNAEDFLDTSITRMALYYDNSQCVIPAVSHNFNADCEGGKAASFATIDGYKNKSQERKTDDNTRESTVVAQNTTNIVASIDYNHATDDGYHWRKYGQKVVKGNSHPRKYYRCTNQNCSARKYVERASDDPDSFITTYEGNHKHESCGIRL